MKLKEINVKIQWEYDKEKSIVKQFFYFDDNGYIYNPNYIIHNKFEDKLIENSLSQKYRNVKAIDMIRGDYKIEILFRVSRDFDFSKLKPIFYKIVSTIPDNNGCRFCKYFISKKSIAGICVLKDNKKIYKELKNCRFFKQKKIYKS